MDAWPSGQRWVAPLECGLKTTSSRARPSALSWFIFMCMSGLFVSFCCFFLLFSSACMVGYHVDTSCLWRPEESFECPVRIVNSRAGAGIWP